MKLRYLLMRKLPAALLGSALVMLLAALFAAQEAVTTKDQFALDMQRINVVPPVGLPPITQESVHLAMAMYNIQVPDNAEYPVLDATLEDRGLTTMSGLNRKLKVSVGPGAFTSWALLGSTLAHELEVHCRQNFTMIRIMDMLGLDGTGQAEREAYMHEIAQAERFGLSELDKFQIRDTMDYFYPTESSDTLAARISQSLGGWLARNPTAHDH